MSTYDPHRSRSPYHRALADADPASFRDAIAAAESVAVSHGLPPQAAADVERVIVHQVAKAIGVRA